MPVREKEDEKKMRRREEEEKQEEDTGQRSSVDMGLGIYFYLTPQFAQWETLNRN